jgi:hypothetical protein
MNLFRIVFLCLVATNIACQGPSTADDAADASIASRDHDSPQKPFYSPAELNAEGFRIIQLDTGKRLLCLGEDDSTCACWRPLACTGDGCPTFDSNLKAFRSALDAPGEGRSVICERAEVGQCGDFRYFDFNGDIHRQEVRWFDNAGRLVAQRNATDHDEYCDGRTSVMFSGDVPKCVTAHREELICGEQGGSINTPLSDLRNHVTVRGPSAIPPPVE